MTAPNPTTPLNFAPCAFASSKRSVLPTQNLASPDSEPSSASSHWSPPPVASSSTSHTSYQAGAPVGSLGPGTSFSSSSNQNGGFSGGGGTEVSSYSGLGYGSALEAAVAYAGPFGALYMIMYEVELDYVRFHAWQVSLSGRETP
ncbi:hypothetical protein P7C70_g5901, partial [Phenoliferia sp. Uapishka_3]